MTKDTLPSPVTLSLRELASEMLAALTALYEACERRANQEGGDFGDDIGPAAELADAAIAKAALLDSLPSVPEGDDLEEVAYEIARWIDSDAVDGSARFRGIVARRIAAALLSVESRARRDAISHCREWVESNVAVGPAYQMEKAVLSSPEEGSDRVGVV